MYTSCYSEEGQPPHSRDLRHAMVSVIFMPFFVLRFPCQQHTPDPQACSNACRRTESADYCACAVCVFVCLCAWRGIACSMCSSSYGTQ